MLIYLQILQILKIVIIKFTGERFNQLSVINEIFSLSFYKIFLANEIQGKYAIMDN